MLQEKAFSDAIISSLPGIFCLFDHEGTFIRWNRNFQEASGYSTRELSRMHPLDFFQGDDKTKIADVIEQASVKGASATEAQFVSKSGKKALYQLTGYRAMIGGKTYVAGMGIDITRWKRSEEALRKSEKQYKDLVENSLVGIFRTNLKGDILFANRNWAKMWEFDSMEEFVSQKAHDGYNHPEDRDILIKALEKAGKVTDFEFEARTRNGNIKNVVVNAVLDGETIFGTIMDVTENHLRQKALMERDVELEIKTKGLEEVNTALRVLLKKRQEDKEELEENVVSNVKELVLPHLEKLKRTRLDADQLDIVRILESNVADIVSPFVRKLSSSYIGLTPAQVQVAMLVKDGKTTKEIAEFMGLSHRTIDFHRDNIRKKLGLRRKKGSLRTRLLSLS